MRLEDFEELIIEDKELKNFWDRIVHLALECDIFKNEILEKKLKNEDYSRELIEKKKKEKEFRNLICSFQNLLGEKNIKIDFNRVTSSLLSYEILVSLA